MILRNCILILKNFVWKIDFSKKNKNKRTDFFPLENKLKKIQSTKKGKASFENFGKKKRKERKEWMFDSSLDMILASQKWIFGDNAKERINRQRHVGNGAFSFIENIRHSCWWFKAWFFKTLVNCMIKVLKSFLNYLVTSLKIFKMTKPFSWVTQMKLFI